MLYTFRNIYEVFTKKQIENFTLDKNEFDLTEFNTTASHEHVPEIERVIRFIEERSIITI